MSRLLYRHCISECRKLLALEHNIRSTVRVLCCGYSSHGNVSSSGNHIPGSSPDKFAYGSEPLAKKDKNAAGLFHLTTLDLPQELDANLKTYLQRYPRNVLENDGRKLAMHLKNRGRPTEATWKKYKESKAAQKKQELKVKLEDVMKLREEQQDHEAIVDYDLDDEQTEETSSSDSESGVAASTLKTKRPKQEEYKVVRYNKRESVAFAASRIPASYGATLKVLHEISRREPDFKPETLMDFGSGTGTAIWAAHTKWSDSIKEYQCIDVSEAMNNLAEFLLRGGESVKRPLSIPYVYFKRFLPVSNKVTYDIVISSYTLTEIPQLAMRKEAIRNLWAKTNDFLVLIEYGNNEGFEVLLEARQMVEKEHSEYSQETIIDSHDNEDSVFQDWNSIDEGYVYAPCPHDTSCPRSDVDTRDHPCNYQQQVQLAFTQRRTPLKKWGFATERFSYLVLRKGHRHEEDQPWPRILEPVKLRGRHVICKLCSSSGKIEQKVLTKKKDSDIYKCVRHLTKWGDLIAMPENRHRPLKNPHITITRRGKLRK